jgi:hypothetical protein
MTTERQMRPILAAGLAWGAIWGLYEATAGYLVHSFVRMPGTSSLLLVPFAVFCMVGAMTASGSRRSAMIAAVTAASIKLVDLLLPNPTLLAVLNPAMAIVLEGLVFTVVARQLGAPERRPSLTATAVGAVAFSTGWRVLFLGWSAILAAGWSTGMLRHGYDLPLGFLVRDSLLSSAVIVALLALVHREGRSPLTARLVPGTLGVAGLLALAVAVEVTVGLLG